MAIAISVEGVSKRYRLGAIGGQTLRDDVTRWWARVRRRPDPLARIGERPVAADAEHIWALRAVSFEVRQGQVLGIIGRNGAGKSTLLKVLSRITAPTEGQVRMNGRVASLLEVGTGFHAELTGRENVYLNGAILGMRKREIDRKLDEIVDFSEVDRFIDTPVKRYSSGMYVRLAFAVAAHLDPEILIVDEVLAVGDASFQKKCLNKMHEAAGLGRTVLFVSHNMPALVRLCPSALWLASGRVVGMGPSVEVVAAYLRTATQVGEARAWSEAEAPGTHQVKLLSVELLVNGEPSRSVASVRDELRIRLSYLVKSAPLRFRCALSFWVRGVCAFAAVEPTEVERPRTGLYHSTVTIPPDLLAEEEYSVSASLFSSRGLKVHLLSEPDVIGFQVSDPLDGQSARGDYSEGLAGMVRPKLHWDIRHVED